MPPPNQPVVTRRALLAAGAATLPWLAGCGTPLPLTVQPGSAAATAGAARLRETAEVHGLAAYRQLRDINIGYDGQWRALIDRVQPVVVDKAFRGSSQERLMPALGINAQHYRGTAGSKHVFWRGAAPGNGNSAVAPALAVDVGVWFNGQRSSDAAVQAASALVAGAYGLFLLGPLWVAERGLAAELAGTERVNGRACDVVHVWLRPGFGFAPLDRVALCIDRDDGITRRVRFTLEGFTSTQGAVAEVDTFEHQRRFGVLWPMRSYEEVVHPLRLPAHDWHVTGLDVNRGYEPAALQGPQFSGAAAAPAAAL
jgi:hypothetical protein